MERSQAVGLIRETFEKPFNADRFRYFARSLLNRIEDSRAVFPTGALPAVFQPYVRSLGRIGNYVDPAGNKLEILFAELQRGTSLVQARSMQRNLIGRHLAQSGNNGALVAFVSPDSDRWRFSYVELGYKLATSDSGRVSAQPELTPARRYSFLVGRAEKSHTAQSQLLPILQEDGRRPSLEAIKQAFSVERVTKEFFVKYADCFSEELEPRVKKILKSDEDAHKFSQLLMNRLMFCWFLQKKGWLGGDPDYLLKLLSRAQNQTPSTRPGEARVSFYNDYLAFLFFDVLSNPEEIRRKRRPRDPAVSWEAPFLNGGLFERTELDRRVEAAPELQRLPGSMFKVVLEDLFDQYNFTVEESTSLDVQVALDPELLGTIFEKLVTGRHETGSYYTPRQVVEFMCRESLVHYLADAVSGSERKTIEALVYDHDVSGLSLADAPRVAQALDAVKVCDPACGSGAYLVTMLHELVAIYRAVYSERLNSPQTDYDLKLNIIERNLYGADIDDFAINIARLRLWLSLVVDNEETDWRKVKALPNLEFKVVQGDSLTAPNPDITQQLHRQEYGKLAPEFGKLTHEYFGRSYSPNPRAKAEVESDIGAVQDDMRRLLGAKDMGDVDWRVDFAEVFVPARDEPGGFDVVLTNPPYLRQEVVLRQFGAQYKADLVTRFPDCCTGTTDIYVAFYARAQQLLRRNGVGCFISSDKWLRAAYGKKLNECLLDSQAFHLVADFGELPVFETAATFPAIFLWQKRPRGRTPTLWATVKDLKACYAEGIREHVARIGIGVPASHFGQGRPRLATSASARIRAKMEASGTRLGEVVKRQVYRGVLTGLNEAFVINRPTRDRLIAVDKRSAELIRPLLIGDDVRRYEMHFRDLYLIFTRRGVRIDDYEAIRKHLLAFKARLLPRPSDWEAKHGEDRWPGRKPGSYEWYEIQDSVDYYATFEKPKIVYPQIMLEPKFCRDTANHYTNQKCFVVGSADWFLVSLLNSRAVWDYLKVTSVAFGDVENRGRMEPRADDILGIPIPESRPTARETVSAFGERAQALHSQRRRLVECFLCDLGSSAAESSSHNVLERPWTLKSEEFTRRAKKYPNPDPRLFARVREQTAALTEEILNVEKEIDERVAGLYGL